MKIQSVFRDMRQIVENALSHNAEESLKTFLNHDPDADDFKV